MEPPSQPRPPARPRRAQFNQVLKLARLWACLHGGPALGEARAMRWFCTSSAVQLGAGVRPPDTSSCKNAQYQWA
jgi:hypothetical protein